LSVRSFYIERELAFALWAYSWGDKKEAFETADQLMKELGVLKHDKTTTSSGNAQSSKAANDGQ
jgi:hypothetical protein